VKRRAFITLLGGAAAWPLAAHAQQGERVRRIGVLTPFPADDAEGHARLTAFAQALQQSGWTVGQNVHIDYRWGPGNAETMRRYATEMPGMPATSCCSRVKDFLDNDEQSESKKAIQIPTNSELINPRVAI
jgi:hypothetical protein